MRSGPPSSHGDDSRALAGWSPGARVGEHVLLERLGGGGMGVVFAAQHVTTGARHALKVLLIDDPDLRARFRREAEALVRVDGHPAIARVHAAGEHRGRPYLVMEHLTGGDLERRLRDGPLPPAEALHVARALCRGLAHVHARGVLHRDLKPANVLLDERGAPRLVDFGLARGPTDGALTRTGEVVGTPSYMAPEQADGRREAQDARTDVYGLGAVLYHMLAGRPPFEGRSLLAVLEQVLRAPPAPPSAFAPGVPPALDDVCLRALAKRPEDRFPDVTALDDALARAAQEVGPARRGSRTLARVVVVTIGAVALAAVIAASRPAAPREPAPAPSRAAAPETVTPAPTLPPASTKPPPRHGPATSGRPATIQEIPDPPATLPERYLSEVPGLALFRLQSLGDPASGVAVSVGRELRRVDPAMAARYLRWAAERSPDPLQAGRAWLDLGELFEDGAGVVASRALAIECRRRGAATGHADGLLELADAQRDGEWGLPRDVAAAAATYRRALDAPAENPASVHDEVAIELGKLALEHPDVVDLADAEALLRDADRQEAKLLLGRLLEARGDRAGALARYEDLAARRDHPEAHLRRARLLLADAPERADELLAGPGDPAQRSTFAWRLWDEYHDLPGARARAVAILRELQRGGDRSALVAGLQLARICRQERKRGFAPTCVSVDEARRLLTLAAADRELARDAREELEKWSE